MSSLNLITRSSLMEPSHISQPFWWLGHIPFAMWLVENTKPRTLVELGTHTGNSYFAMCHSVESNGLSTRCYAVDTWQGDLHQGAYDDGVYRSVKQYNDEHYSGFSDLLRMTFDEALPMFGNGTVDLLHIDGFHTYEAVRHDFETWLPKLSDCAVVLFHDASVKKLDFGVWRLWEELSAKYPSIYFDYSQGLGVLFVGEKLPAVLRELLATWASPDGQSLVHQFFARLGQSVELEHTTISLGLQIASLDERIAGLGRLLEERNDDISSLNRTIVERNERIAVGLQRQNELKEEVKQLHNATEAYRLSTSWRITYPFRKVTIFFQRGVRCVRFVRKYHLIHPGIGGFLRLSRRCIAVIRKEGIGGVKRKIALYEVVKLNVEPEAVQKKPKPILVIDETTDEIGELPKDLAVHAHVSFLDLVPEMRSYLENIPVKFHFYVTTDTAEKAAFIERAFLSMGNVAALDIRVTEGRGGDMLPMLTTLGAELVQHEVVLHIHTKETPRDVSELAGWRRYLMESLLGSTQRVTKILQRFALKKDMGVLFPDIYSPAKSFFDMYSSSSKNIIERLLDRIGNEGSSIANVDQDLFSAGEMFWFRGKVIQAFLAIKLSTNDFETGTDQMSMAMRNALECMIPFFAGEMGLSSDAYISNSVLSPQCSAYQLKLLRSYLDGNLIKNPTIIFDHNGGGGANIYSHELIRKIHEDGGDVLRVYCLDAVWFVFWVGVNDGMLFFTSSIEELFEVFAITNTTNIVLNSLYGCPDIEAVASRTIALSRVLNCALSFKVHDFYAECPSPHLYDFEEKYCGVPQDLDQCSLCLKNNNGWFHSWYPDVNKPDSIERWRKPFADILEAATSVTFFDQSSVDIFRRAFFLDDKKIEVVPHVIDAFNCRNLSSLKGPIHIGVLGTLSSIKGGSVVVALHEYIERSRLAVPITIVGNSWTDLPEDVCVVGKYDRKDLPSIVVKQGVNVILMPSVVPETFSYTISEAMAMGLPIVAFDLGAQGSRVKNYEFGKVVPLGSPPEVIFAAICSALKVAQELIK